MARTVQCVNNNIAEGEEREKEGGEERGRDAEKAGVEERKKAEWFTVDLSASHKYEKKREKGRRKKKAR